MPKLTLDSQLVLATGNKGKIAEFTALLNTHPIELLSQNFFCQQEAEENGLSFIENAIIKARHAAKHSGLPALADDSGIVVDALNGEPGIYSARYAGTHGDSAANNKKLLTALIDVEKHNRQAHFVCVLAYVRHTLDPEPLIIQRSWYGEILTTPQGEQGFGYDPIFYVPEYNCSAAELSLDIKNQISHRGQALQALINIVG